MARARNIKPGFFRNADLVEFPFETRLLFAGLWTIADREGRLEDRPKQIKMEIFPADSLDVNELLDQLASADLIQRYEVEGKRFIQVTNFKKHQNPHSKEQASIIPAQVKPGASPVQAPVNNEANPVVDMESPVLAGLIPSSLIPDSLNLIPDSLIPQSAIAPVRAKPAAGKPATDYPPDFEPAWDAYPKKTGANKAASVKAWKARIKAGTDPQTILSGTLRYAAFCRTSQTEDRFIKQPATFFGPDNHFLSDWTPPPPRLQAGSGREARISNYAAEAAIARGEHGNGSLELDITGDSERVD